MAWITDAQLKSRVAGLLKVDPTTLYTDAPAWEEIVGDSRSAAYNEVVGALALRGYSAAQIDGWDRGQEFQKDLGLFWALTKGGGLQAADDKFIAKLDRREELKTVAVTVDGVLVDPAAGEGEVSYGAAVQSVSQFQYSVTTDGVVTKPPW